MTFGKTRLLASTAPLYGIALKYTELVGNWHRQPQPPCTYCLYYRAVDPLVHFLRPKSVVTEGTYSNG